MMQVFELFAARYLTITFCVICLLLFVCGCYYPPRMNVCTLCNDVVEGASNIEQQYETLLQGDISKDVYNRRKILSLLQRARIAFFDELESELFSRFEAYVEYGKETEDMLELTFSFPRTFILLDKVLQIDRDCVEALFLMTVIMIKSSYKGEGEWDASKISSAKDYLARLLSNNKGNIYNHYVSQIKAFISREFPYDEFNFSVLDQKIRDLENRPKEEENNEEKK